MLTKNIRILITFAVLAGLVFSTSVALANFSNGPENPGPIVMRGEDGLAIWYPDYKAGLSVVHGIDMDELCSGSEDFDLIAYQDIMSPSEVGRIISVMQGDNITTSVWPTVADFFDFFDIYCEIEPIATGTVRILLTDNDLFGGGFGDGKPNMNAFGLSAHGKLTWTDGGGLAHYNGLSNCVWDGFDTSDARFICKDKINIH